MSDIHPMPVDESSWPGPMRRRGMQARFVTERPTQVLFHSPEASESATHGRFGPRPLPSTQVPVRTCPSFTSKVEDPLGWTVGYTSFRHLRSFARCLPHYPAWDVRAETHTPYPASPARIYAIRTPKTRDLLGANQRPVTTNCCFTSFFRHHSNPWPLARSYRDNRIRETRTEVLASYPDSHAD
jgi:hypothetical protein